MELGFKGSLGTRFPNARDAEKQNKKPACAGLKVWSY
jgi:hypothetical protein